MAMIDDILEFNKKFVESKGYEKYITNKYPDKKIAILSCMDTRLTELLPAALGIKNGDVKIIKNAGGVISHPFGSVIRSLMVAIYELGVKEVMVVAHSDCGACHMNSNEMIEHMKARGIKQETIDMIRFCGVDFGAWLDGFEDTEKSVKGTVRAIMEHPLIPEDIMVRGFIIDSFYGSLYLFHVFLLSESMMISIHFVPIATGKVGYGNRCISVFYRKTGQVGHTAPFC